jgi:hypothetical protein
MYHLPNANLQRRVWRSAQAAARMLAVMVMVIMLSPQVAQAAPLAGSAALDAIGKKVLEVLAQLAGLVATMGGVVVGIRVVYGAMMGSPRAISDGITALVSVAFGIALVASGPQLARYIYDAL